MSLFDFAIFKGKYDLVFKIQVMIKLKLGEDFWHSEVREGTDNKCQLKIFPALLCIKTLDKYILWDLKNSSNKTALGGQYKNQKGNENKIKDQFQ